MIQLHIPIQIRIQIQMLFCTDCKCFTHGRDLNRVLHSILDDRPSLTGCKWCLIRRMVMGYDGHGHGYGYGYGVDDAVLVKLVMVKVMIQ